MHLYNSSHFYPLPPPLPIPESPQDLNIWFQVQIGLVVTSLHWSFCPEPKCKGKDQQWRHSLHQGELIQSSLGRPRIPTASGQAGEDRSQCPFVGGNLPLPVHPISEWHHSRGEKGDSVAPSLDAVLHCWGTSVLIPCGDGTTRKLPQQSVI